MDCLSHEEIDAKLGWPELIDQLQRWIAAQNVVSPERHVHSMKQPDGSEASLLIMPAWVPGQSLGVKVVTFFPQNSTRGQATINACYMLFDGATGRMRSLMDGDAITSWRTAAASALAARYLARDDASRLLVVGTGQLSVAMARAHASVRNYDVISVWGRTQSKAAAVAGLLSESGLKTNVAEDLELACKTADVISTITPSDRPIVKGKWLRPGTHLDLVGAFRETMRESDDQAISQARLFVDTRAGALKSGDLHQPINSGVIDSSHIQADLLDLCNKRHPGRVDGSAFTVFKSVGMSLEDLAAAELAIEASH